MQKVQGFTEQGNTTVVISSPGGTSTRKFQGSFPLCTITVFAAGTANLSTIYSDNSSTPLANPFTATSSGTWFFYAATGHYDVRFSGGGIPAPFTLGDFVSFDPTSYTGPSTVSQSITSGSTVVSDHILDDTSPTGDSGAIRGVARQLGAGNSLIRAVEAQTVRSTGASQNNTWGIEIGVHSQVAGNGATLNVGVYIASSHTGWLASGIRNDTGVLIVGEDGWTNAIRYYDTNGSTILFNVDQNGNLSLAGSLKVGAAPAASGGIRMSNASGIIWNNAAGNADIIGIVVDASNRVQLSPNGNDILWGRALINLGGGAAPTLGTIGGSGPVGAAQTHWFRFIDNGGTTRFMPVFT